MIAVFDERNATYQHCVDNNFIDQKISYFQMKQRGAQGMKSRVLLSESHHRNMGMRT